MLQCKKVQWLLQIFLLHQASKEWSVFKSIERVQIRKSLNFIRMRLAVYKSFITQSHMKWCFFKSIQRVQIRKSLNFIKMKLAIYKRFITHEIFCMCTWRLRDILVMPVLSAEISVAIKDTSGDSLVTASLVEMMSLLTSVTFLESSLIWPSTFSTDFIWLFMVNMEFVRPDIPTQKWWMY